MSKLNEIIKANSLLVSLGGEDQLQNIAAAAIERSLELQNRVDQALEYANSSASASVHVRNMASILLYGSATVADEPNISPASSKVKTVTAKPKKTTPQKRKSGLSGRSTAERRAFRKWAEEQGLNLPNAGPIPQELIDFYDKSLNEPQQMMEEPPTTDSESV